VGQDSGNSYCSLTSPCLTISHAVEVGGNTIVVNILECFYPINPFSITGGLVLMIWATVSQNTLASLAWNSSYSGSGTLLSVTNGTLSIEYVTIWHNSSSKGPIMGGSSGSGSIALKVLHFLYGYIKWYLLL
jgi:hypothetical protein